MTDLSLGQQQAAKCQRRCRALQVSVQLLPWQSCTSAGGDIICKSSCIVRACVCVRVGVCARVCACACLRLCPWLCLCFCLLLRLRLGLCPRLCLCVCLCARARWPSLACRCATQRRNALRSRRSASPGLAFAKTCGPQACLCAPGSYKHHTLPTIFRG